MAKPYMHDRIGERVNVALDDAGTSREQRQQATLLRITSRGHRVRFDDGTERTVAWWRLSPLVRS
jgi:hypothetical protein